MLWILLLLENHGNFICTRRHIKTLSQTTKYPGFVSAILLFVSIYTFSALPSDNFTLHK